jgi:hypothetical protein
MSAPDYERELQEAILLATSADDPRLRRAYEDLASFHRKKLRKVSESPDVAGEVTRSTEA